MSAKEALLDHAVRARFLPNSDFSNSFADRGHGFEIVRLLAILHSLQLTTRIAPGVLGKVAQILQGTADEHDLLHMRQYIRLDIRPQLTLW